MTGSGDERGAQPPNLDLIALVQAARKAYDAGAQPSQVQAVYWIEADREADGPGPTARAGSWVLEPSAGEVDGLWAIIRAATREGALGYKARVLTAPRTGGPASPRREIHIVTYDADDTADVERVRAALAALGIQAPMTYQRNKPASGADKTNI
mgnify:CR=1 FL=1